MRRPLVRRRRAPAGGTARTADGAIATGGPGGEEVGFPEGSLPTGGMPGVRPKGEPTPPADVPAAPAEQLSLL